MTDGRNLRNWFVTDLWISVIEGSDFALTGVVAISGTVIHVVAGRSVLVSIDLALPGGLHQTRAELAVRPLPAGSRIDLVHWNLSEESIGPARNFWRPRLPLLVALVRHL